MVGGVVVVVFKNIGLKLLTSKVVVVVWINVEVLSMGLEVGTKVVVVMWIYVGGFSMGLELRVDIEAGILGG